MYQKVIKNERNVISKINKGTNIPLDCENKTGTGLVENEVTRRGNSPSEGKVREDPMRGRAKGQRAGRKITSNICSRTVPGRCRREKSANQEKLSPGDSERILFETNARGDTLVQSYDFVICRNPRALSDVRNGVSLDVTCWRSNTFMDSCTHKFKRFARFTYCRLEIKIDRIVAQGNVIRSRVRNIKNMNFYTYKKDTFPIVILLPFSCP